MTLQGQSPREIRITSGDRERLAKLAYWLDERFRIPGTHYRVGVDGIAGLIPGIGDGITTALSIYIVLEARRFGVPKTMLWRMIWNSIIDGVVGTIPLVGDLFDIHWKANRKNIFLLNEYLAHYLEKENLNNPVITERQFQRTTRTTDEPGW